MLVKCDVQASRGFLGGVGMEKILAWGTFSCVGVLSS